jgi:hypothetical protein
MAGISTQKTNGGDGGSSAPTSMVQFAIVEGVKSILNRMKNAFSVNLPENHYAPEGADSFDIRVVGIIDPESKETLLSYKALDSQTIRFIRYGIYTNIVPGQNVDFFPTKQGSRILRYHGDCNDNFKLNLSVGPDLTENSLIPCDIILRPGEVLEWKVVNNGAVKSDVGVRMRGFLVNENKNGGRGFGG